MNLKRQLEECNLSVALFSRIAGVPQPTMHRIVNGLVDPSSIRTGNFLKISGALGLSAEELFYDEPHYDLSKREIDRVFALTTAEGRIAMLANARGVLENYPSQDGPLPCIGDGMPDLAIL